MRESLAEYVAAHSIRIEIDSGPDWAVEELGEGKTWDHHAYTLNLINGDQGTTMSIAWKQGIGLTRDPDERPEMVVDCLISDSWGYENARSFEEWAGDYGYDPDSLRALRIWETLKTQSAEFIDWLGGRDELEILALEYERL